MGGDRQAGRDAADRVGKTQVDRSSSEAVNEVFSQWQTLSQNQEQLTGFTEALSPYLPQLTVAFLGKDSGSGETFFDLMDANGDGVLQKEEIEDLYSDDTTGGAAKLFAKYLIDHFDDFDGADGNIDGRIDDGTLMRERGFTNAADGSVTRITQDGRFEITYPNGIKLYVRETETAGGGNAATQSSQYLVPGPPQVTLVNQGGNRWTVKIGETQTTVEGTVRMTADGVVLTRADGSTAEYRPNGKIYSRDGNGRITSIDLGNVNLERFAYDGSGNLSDYWANGMHWWRDQRSLSTTQGTWYLDGSSESASSVTVDRYSGDTTVDYNGDKPTTTWHVDGRVTLAYSTGVSITRDSAQQIVSCIIPPDTEPWYRVDDGDGDGNPADDRWARDRNAPISAHHLDQPTIQFNETNGMAFTLTYSLDTTGYRTRSITFDGSGNVTQVFNPDGSRFAKVGDHYEYTPFGGSPVQATFAIVNGEPVFTVNETGGVRQFAFNRNGEMTMTLRQGENVTTVNDQGQTTSEQHIGGNTIIRNGSNSIIVIDDATGDTVRYNHNVDGSWRITRGRTAVTTDVTTGVTTRTFTPTPGETIARGGFDGTGKFVLFNDVDQNMQTFDPGESFLTIAADGTVAEVPFSSYSGPLSFTDANGVVSSMQVTNGRITGLEQTTPDGRHLSVQFRDGAISSITLPDGSTVRPEPQTDGSVRWRHFVNGRAGDYLADRVVPTVSPSGEVNLGAGNVWRADSDGRMFWRMQTENGFEEHRADGSYTVQDSDHRVSYDANGRKVEEVFGNNYDRSHCVIMTYVNGQLNEVTMPSGDRCVRNGQGQWVYTHGTETIILSQAPQVDSEGRIVTLSFRSPAQDGSIGLRVGEHPFFERIMPEGIVVNGSGDSQTGNTSERFPTGVIVSRTNGEITGITLPDGSSYQRVQVGNPPSWRFIRQGERDVVVGNITTSPDGRTVTITNGADSQVYHYSATGAIESIESTRSGQRTVTNFLNGQISSVVLPDNSQLVPRTEGGVTILHWMHDGQDSPLSRNTTLSLDERGGLIFNNPTAADTTQPLVASNGGWEVPLPNAFAIQHTDGTNQQIRQITLPDGQGTWTRVEGAPTETWRFRGPDGVVIERAGHLTANASGTVTFENAGTREVYTYSAENGALQTVAITDANGTTTVSYENGRINRITLPAGNIMQFGSNDHWTISVVGSTTPVDILGTPAVIGGRLVMQYGDTTTPIAAQAGIIQFRTVDGVISLNRQGRAEVTSPQQIRARLAADSSWLAPIAGADGSITRNELQAALDANNLTVEQREVVLYLIQNCERLHPHYDSAGQTLLLVTEAGVEFYANGTGSRDKTVTPQELILMMNPNLPNSLWTTLAQNGQLTRAHLNEMIQTGNLTPEQRAAALYLQANWNRIAPYRGEDILDISDVIGADNLLAYGRANGINFPEAPITDTPPPNSPEVVTEVGQPVVVSTLADRPTTNSGAPDSRYVAVEWLNQHQLFMRQFMVVDASTGQRTGQIDQQKVTERINSLTAKNPRSADEQMQLDALNALQTYLTTPANAPHTAERFFRSVLLNGQSPENGPVGARLLGPTDTVYSMARQFLIEKWCHEHGKSAQETQQILEDARSGRRLDPELTRYVSENLQDKIDFIFEANHIVGNNIAVGQLLILDPALVPTNNDAVYLSPQNIDRSVFTEVPAENQNPHVTHVQNRRTGEEAYLFENGLTLTRGTTGDWCAFDEHGNLLGMVKDNAVSPELIASGNFTLQLEPSGDLPIASIVVSNQKTTVVFQQGGTEDIYPNGVHVHFNSNNVVDKVVLPNGVTVTQMIGPNNQVTGYQIRYPGGATAIVTQPPLPAPNGAITLTGADGRITTIAADGTIMQTPVSYAPGGGGYNESLAIAS